jgi:transposase
MTAIGWTTSGEAMRGSDQRAEGLFSYVSCEQRVPADHPLRAILPIVDAALASLSTEFQKLYAVNGRPSIAPERLLRALLLQAFYSVRSERQLMEQLDYNLLFRWFVGLGIDDPIWDVTVFTKNRDRLLEGEIAARFLRAVLEQPKVKGLLSDEHFSVDGLGDAACLQVLLLGLAVALLRGRDDRGVDQLPRHRQVAGLAQRLVEQCEQALDRPCLGQRLAEGPDRVRVRHRIAEAKAEKADPGQAVAQKELGALVAEIAQRLQGQHFKHEHMVERWPAALRPIRPWHGSLQLGPEQLEVDHAIQPLEIVALPGHAGQPLLQIEEPSLTRHRDLQLDELIEER